ncbi:MAG: hypothetical protein GX222_04360 [Ruminococcaceae bacterium]|nr:hypothetical protein [Oscillospiraceae bacterium]
MKKIKRAAVFTVIMIICLMMLAGCGKKPDLYFVSYSGTTKKYAEEDFGKAFEVKMTDPAIVKASPGKGDYVVLQMSGQRNLDLNNISISEDGGEWVDYLLFWAKSEYNRTWSDPNAYQKDVEELASKGIKVLMYVSGTGRNGEGFCTEAHWMEKGELKSETGYYISTYDYKTEDIMKDINEYFLGL